MPAAGPSANLWSVRLARVIDPDAYREQSRANWSSMAAGWARRREWMAGVTGTVHDWIVDRADPQPGQRFLDLAGGTGDLSRQVAERVAPGGSVLYTDFASEMVEVARGVPGPDNVEFRQMDAERMDLDDDSFDGVVCRYGYMLMADPAAALAETRRVLRDGGRLAFGVWQGADRNPWAALPARTLLERGHVPPPEPGAPGIFSMGDPERIHELVTGAGFEEPEIAEIPAEWRYDDGDDVWGTLMEMTGPLARVIRTLPEEEQEACKAATLEKEREFRNDDGSYTIPGASWGVLTR
jgi:SAM-dependent methyltransferase